MQIACSHLVLLNRDGNLSTKDLANALAPFAQKKDSKFHRTRPCGRTTWGGYSGLRVNSNPCALHPAASCCPGRSTGLSLRIHDATGRCWPASQASRLVGQAAKREPAMLSKIGLTIFLIVAPCTALSFRLPRGRPRGAHAATELGLASTACACCVTDAVIEERPAAGFRGSLARTGLLSLLDAVPLSHHTVRSRRNYQLIPSCASQTKRTRNRFAWSRQMQ